MLGVRRVFFQHLYLYTSRILSGHCPSISNFWEPHRTHTWFIETLTPGSGHCYLDMSMTQVKFRCCNNYIYSVSSQNFSGWPWQHPSGFGKGRGVQWYLSGLSEILLWAQRALCPQKWPPPLLSSWEICCESEWDSASCPHCRWLNAQGND